MYVDLIGPMHDKMHFQCNVLAKHFLLVGGTKLKKLKIAMRVWFYTFIVYAVFISAGLASCKHVIYMTDCTMFCVDNS